ncbi:MAG TPA: DUF1592 domain-containing protein, partial [Kofleriaceae bacterium]|nr:DUF1592 domain-containing protein [Kofleriaceae bacterium]
AALAAGALAGCTSGGGGGGDADDDSVTPPPAPPSTPIRRLNRIELLNTLEDLIGPAYMGDFDEIGHRLPPDPLVGGLDTISQSLGTSATYVEQIGGLIEFIVGKIDLGMVAPGPMTDAALPALFDSFGRRALRRPLTADERASYTALYDHLAPDQGHTVAIQAVLQRMLLSPDFLYQVALGDAATGKLTDHEMASRLSYLLWETMPDAELDAAADQGALHTPEQVEAQLTRLAADPRAQATIMRFVRAWLELDGLDTIAKDPRFYPEFAGLRPAMIESFDRFLADTVATGDLATLLSSNEAYVDDGLASLYGVAGPGPGMMVRTQLPGNQRAGMMTQAAFLSVFGKADRSAPILRGVFILDRLLCAPPDPPPPGGGVIPPDLPSPTTTRDFFANLTSPPGCQTCHSIINPIGFGFEHYDAIGRWRIEENGYPIDSTGHVAVDGADTPFDGAIQLGDALAHSDTVRRCLVRRWFRSRFGRIDTADDAPIIDDLDGAFAGDSAQLRALPAILAHTDAFYRPHFQLASAP